MNFSTLFARALLSIAAPAALLAAPAPAVAAESADLAKVQAHLKAVQSMTANFVQTDGKGRSARGTLQLKRPGRIRFEYSGGDVLLVANGSRLTFVDYQVGQKNSWDLNKTPLGMLLSVNPILKGNARLQPSGNPRTIVLRAKDRNRPEYGTLILAFLRSPSAPGGLMLYGWTAVDAQNKRTTVKLSNQRYNVAVSEGAFTYAEPKKRKRS
ncbi:outer membrane lipoprotein carrier protein LolA [Sphingomonas sp.]|uniref:LolA family protein n=1 Tax=Sphingomonas sp. TaxID=28214 RepID=UPI0017F9AD24|nr:outer membrane lipoprotein carrier protein LolA [Sphingomonas sp.]MBA3510611.1 outer membrane lipoprotein carrier protein LolA [Sphingomonas sp.]